MRGEIHGYMDRWTDKLMNEYPKTLNEEFLDLLLVTTSI